MDAVAAEHELYKACRVIFGAELNVSRQFLKYLQMPGVKSAYRQRAKESHPDLLARQGVLAQKRGTQQFHSVKEAYESLKLYVSARENGYRFALASPVRREAAAARPAAGKQERQWTQQGRRTSQLFQGSMPRRPMLFGHFLYYSCLIDWQTLAQALVWQRSNRPRLGEIGRRFGWFSATDVDTILHNKPAQEMFGKAALKSGKLTPSQLRMIVSFQKAQQKKIGEYFVQRRIFDQRKLVELLPLFHAHNARQKRSCHKASRSQG